jgi:hypothetical protein
MPQLAAARRVGGRRLARCVHSPQQIDEVKGERERIRDGAPGRQAERRDDRTVLLRDQRGTRESGRGVESRQADELGVVLDARRSQEHAVEAGSRHVLTVSSDDVSRNTKASQQLEAQAMG